MTNIRFEVILKTLGYIMLLVYLRCTQDILFLHGGLQEVFAYNGKYQVCVTVVNVHEWVRMA